jgi:RNA polymerase sigma-70 factor (ECF subfamily)
MSNVGQMAESIDWSRAVEENRRWLTAVLRARLGDVNAVDDVLQEVGLAVLNQPKRPTDPQKVAPWLYRIALRKSVDYRRSQGRQRRLQDGLRQRLPRDQQPAASEWLMQLEDQNQIRNALDRIGQADRQLLVLKYGEHWSYQQIAAHLGCTVKTIEYRLLRAKEALRDQMEGMMRSEVKR